MKRKAIFYAVCALCVLMFLGACSQKKYFEPKDVSLSTEFEGKIPDSIESISRYGAILENLELLESNGEINLKLQKNQRFLARDDGLYLLQNECKNLVLLESESKNLSEINFEGCVVSASMSVSQNLLAFVSLENTLFLYDLREKKEIFNQKLSRAIAINALASAPIITQTQVIFPSLDGKILIFDLRSKIITRDILIQSDKFFNNIIYLYAKNDIIIAATQKRISTILSNAKSFNYDGDFIDMLVSENKIYVLTNDGKILELDSTLKLLRELKLEYAHFRGIVIKDKKLYTLESAKYLIELDLQSFLPVIYKVKLPSKKNLFYTQDTLYYDGRFKRF